MRYTIKWDLPSIPVEEFTKEWIRRRKEGIPLKLKLGRPLKPRCPKCGDIVREIHRCK